MMENTSGDCSSIETQCVLNNRPFEDRSVDCGFPAFVRHGWRVDNDVLRPDHCGSTSIQSQQWTRDEVRLAQKRRNKAIRGPVVYFLRLSHLTTYAQLLDRNPARNRERLLLTARDENP